MLVFNPPLLVTEKSTGISAQNFQLCFYNSMEMRIKWSLFLLGNTGTKKHESHLFIYILKIQTVFALGIIIQ